jgi:hypothetical protein
VDTLHKGDNDDDYDDDDDDDDDDNNNNNNNNNKSGPPRRNRGLFTAIQVQVLLTRNYKKYILQHPNTNEMCRRCGKESETIQHITAACEQLAPTEYVKRRDGVANIIHQKLAEAAELIEGKSPYYKYTPANVLENDSFKLYWNRSIFTDKEIPSNQPDITLMNKKTKNTFLIDLAVPNTHNLAKTITDKQT